MSSSATTSSSPAVPATAETLRPPRTEGLGSWLPFALVTVLALGGVLFSVWHLAHPALPLGLASR